MSGRGKLALSVKELETGEYHYVLLEANERTQYRYTAIYKLSGDALRAAHVFDRACEYRTWLKAVPLDKSFCQHRSRRASSRPATPGTSPW